MKRKFWTVILAVTLMSALVACGKKEDTADEKKEDQTTQEKAQEEADDQAENVKDQDVTISLSGLQQQLNDAGVVSGDPQEPLYDMVGAINGVKYLDSNVEIYEFSDQEKLEAAKESFADSNPVVNGNFLLIFTNGTKDQKVIDAFNAYK